MVSKTPKEVSATAFQAHCLSLMDDVRRTGEEVLITMHGRVVARLAPAEPPPASFLGWMAGTVTLTGDLVDPDPDDAIGWDAMP